MRITATKQRNEWLIRLFGRSGEVAYLVIGIQGACAEIEFPSDWHEYRRAWVRIGFILFRVAFSFPWPWVVPDEYQCSGPTYGFTFFDDGLHLHWGKCKGRGDDPMAAIGMPWRWRHKEHKILSEPEQHEYLYLLRSQKLQRRVATIREESRLWVRPWLPHKRLSRYIDIQFDAEVGERTGSWKGGVLGCNYEMRKGEKPVDTLIRMQRERKFD